MKNKFILASKSPRRKELLSQIIKDFIICPANIDEEAFPLNEVSLQKGKCISNIYPKSWILSADTYVLFNNEVFGKPKDKEDAYRILKILSNQTHQVTTYFTLINNEKDIIYTSSVTSHVTFNDLSDELINCYIDSLSPLDKAGAYGIQDNEKYHFIKKYEGSLDNIIGLPLKEVKEAMIKLKII